MSNQPDATEPKTETPNAKAANETQMGDVKNKTIVDENHKDLITKPDVEEQSKIPTTPKMEQTTTDVKPDEQSSEQEVSQTNAVVQKPILTPVGAETENVGKSNDDNVLEEHKNAAEAKQELKTIEPKDTEGINRAKSDAEKSDSSTPKAEEDKDETANVMENSSNIKAISGAEPVNKIDEPGSKRKESPEKVTENQTLSNKKQKVLSQDASVPLAEQCSNSISE